jgi:hypothetical protein
VAAQDTNDAVLETLGASKSWDEAAASGGGLREAEAR